MITSYANPRSFIRMDESRIAGSSLGTIAGFLREGLIFGSCTGNRLHRLRIRYRPCRYTVAALQSPGLTIRGRI